MLGYMCLKHATVAELRQDLQLELLVFNRFKEMQIDKKNAQVCTS